MAVISNNIKDYIDVYDGYNAQAVGLGLQTGAYASKAYAKRKVKNLLIGTVASIVYSPHEFDISPLIVPIIYESAYNTILAYNLHYIPIKDRQAIMKFILDSNAARIKSNQPLLLDYHSIKRSVPNSQYCVRRYKTLGIGVREVYPLAEVPTVIKEPSQWSRHYLHYKNASKKRKNR